MQNKAILAKIATLSVARATFVARPPPATESAPTHKQKTTFRAESSWNHIKKSTIIIDYKTAYYPNFEFWILNFELYIKV